MVNFGMTRGGPKYYGQTEPKLTFPFDLQSKFPKYLAKRKAPRASTLKHRLMSC